MKDKKFLLTLEQDIYDKKYNKISTPAAEPETALNPTVFGTHKPTKERNKKSSLKLFESFLNKVANDETNGNTEKFNGYFKHHNPSFLAKDL